MLALRQGAARLAPRSAQVARTTRRYASGGAHHAEEVNEPIGVSHPWTTTADAGSGDTLRAVWEPYI